ncbi:hypothetical protein BH11GEM2_BH11GEM2_31520 [soil metagenome]
MKGHLRRHDASSVPKGDADDSSLPVIALSGWLTTLCDSALSAPVLSHFVLEIV